MNTGFSMADLVADPGLPEFCYTADAGDGVLAAVKRGHEGYYVVDRYPTQAKAEEAADRHNARLGVSPEQKRAMVTGSMFGWHVPGARLTRA